VATSTCALLTQDIVCECNYTLFVVIDEYDAPGNNCAFGIDVHLLDEERRDKVEEFFNVNLFAVLKRGCGNVISKLFVTGVTPAFRAGISPLITCFDISNGREFHGMCGFSEEETRTMIRCYLDCDTETTDVIIDSMRRLYNGYCFVDNGFPSLYNPQLVFHYLRTHKSHGFVSQPAEPSAVNSTHILTCIANREAVGIDDLIRLTARGSVSASLQRNFGFSDLLRSQMHAQGGGQTNLIWSLLYSLEC
jgi:Predicted AAA-ATPase